jgi:hypothetical protein
MPPVPGPVPERSEAVIRPKFRAHVKAHRTVVGLKKLTDRIARDRNSERKVWYLNRFLRIADDIEEGLNDNQSWSRSNGPKGGSIWK